MNKYTVSGIYITDRKQIKPYDDGDNFIEIMPLTYFLGLIHHSGLLLVIALLFRLYLIIILYQKEILGMGC